MTSATLGKPLSRECLLYHGRTSLDVAGQWPVCRAGASPTEDRWNAHARIHISAIVAPFRDRVNGKGS